jgi:hypothetical protein
LSTSCNNSSLFFDFLLRSIFSSENAFFLQEFTRLPSKPVAMSDDDLSLMIEFFERCGPEVTGHALLALPPDQSAIIERFIAGRCDDTERRELSRFLQLHPVWIRWIAERIKTDREVDDPSAAAGV